MRFRMKYIKRDKKAANDNAPTQPKLLKSSNDWRIFWEGCYRHIKEHREANDVLLQYIWRNNVGVVDAIQDIIYTNSDEDFMVAFLLEGDNYIADSKRAYNKLKLIVINGPGCADIIPFDERSDGQCCISIPETCYGKFLEED